MRFSWFVMVALVIIGAFVFGDAAVAQFPYGRQDFPPPYQAAAPNYGMRLTFILVPALFGAIIGFFFSPALAEFRKWVILGCGVVLLTAAIFGPPGWGDLLSSFAGVVAFVAGIVFGLKILAVQQRRRLSTFGSAQWADFEHINAYGLDKGEGFLLGTFDAPARKRNKSPTTVPLRYNGDRHLLTIAPTRAGKGVSAVIPNLLTYQGSALVIDPKGENALITMLARHKLGHKIMLVDPWNLVLKFLPDSWSAACFNPLDWLKPDDPDIAENAMLLADALVVKTDKGNPFWDEESKALLMGVILYVATEAGEAATRNLGRVRDLLMMDGDGLTDLFNKMYKSDHPVVAGTGARSLQKDSELLSNVLASAQAHTHFLDSPRIRNSLSKSDFAFEDLKTSNMTIYLVLPADRLKAFSRWLRLLIQQAITVNARNIDQRPAKPILFLLDEMAALGHLSMVEQAYGLMAGFGMQLWGIVQDASQLKRIYGDGWETFIANSGVLQYFGSRDSMTSEYFSKLCGMSTILNVSSSIARAISSATGGNSTTTSNNYADTQRHLAYADELMRLPGHRQLLLVENMDPISANKIRWFDDKSLSEKGVELKIWRESAKKTSAQKPSQPAGASSAKSAETNVKPKPAAAPSLTPTKMMTRPRIELKSLATKPPTEGPERKN